MPFRCRGLVRLMRAAGWHWFDALEGDWQLRRRMLDLSGHLHAASATVSISGHLVGMATFTRIDEATMSYKEFGELVLRDGTRLKAERRYLYRLEDDAWVIEFADGPDSGRRFLRFTSISLEKTQKEDGRETSGRKWGEREASGRWSVADDHLCGRDLYQAEYRFSGFTQRAAEALRQSAAPGRNHESDQRFTPRLALGSTAERSSDKAEAPGGKQILVQRTVVSGPRKDYAIVSRLQR